MTEAIQALLMLIATMGALGLGFALLIRILVWAFPDGDGTTRWEK